MAVSPGIHHPRHAANPPLPRRRRHDGAGFPADGDDRRHRQSSPGDTVSRRKTRPYTGPPPPRRGRVSRAPMRCPPSWRSRRASTTPRHAENPPLHPPPPPRQGRVSRRCDARRRRSRRRHHRVSGNPPSHGRRRPRRGRVRAPMRRPPSRRSRRASTTLRHAGKPALTARRRHDGGGFHVRRCDARRHDDHRRASTTSDDANPPPPSGRRIASGGVARFARPATRSTRAQRSPEDRVPAEDSWRPETRGWRRGSSGTLRGLAAGAPHCIALVVDDPPRTTREAYSVKFSRPSPARYG